jgi:hypothetical protein
MDSLTFESCFNRRLRAKAPELKKAIEARIEKETKGLEGAALEAKREEIENEETEKVFDQTWKEINKKSLKEHAIHAAATGAGVFVGLTAAAMTAKYMSRPSGKAPQGGLFDSGDFKSSKMKAV